MMYLLVTSLRFNPNDFHINVGGNEQDVDSSEKIIEYPFFEGAYLNDIADEIENLEE